ARSRRRRSGSGAWALRALAQRLLAAMASAVRAAIHFAVGFHAVAEDAAAAMCAHRGELLDRALEAVEGMRAAACDAHGKSLVVTVTAHFAGRHGSPMLRGACAARVSLCALVRAPFPWRRPCGRLRRSS